MADKNFLTSSRAAKGDTLPYTIESFKKTDGVLGNESGVPTYTMSYEAVYQCTRDSDTKKKGDKWTERGEIRLQRTEKGWH